MVTPAHRAAFVAAGTELAAASVAFDGSVNMTRRLPWFIGRATTIRDMDASLAATAVHAREALRHLDGLELEPGAGADAVAQVRNAVREYVGLVEARQALPTASARWYDTSIERGAGRMPERLADGLTAIGEDRTFAWTTRPVEMLELDPHASVGARRMLAPIESEVADRVLPFLSDQPLSWDPVARELVDRYVGDGGTSRHDLPGQVLWAISQTAFNAGETRLPASDLRRIVDDLLARPRTPLQQLQKPWWIDAMVDDAPVVIDPARAADLAIMRHTGSPKHVDLFVAQALMSDVASRMPGANFRAEIAAAARRLPDGYGSRVPAGIEHDPVALTEWSRTVRTRYARSVADGHPPSAELIQTLLDPTSHVGLGYSVGGAIVARELVDQLDAVDPMRRAMVANLRTRLDAFIASSERSWHVDYGELGRVRAASALLARVEDRAAHVAAARAADPIPGTIAW